MALATLRPSIRTRRLRTAASVGLALVLAVASTALLAQTTVAVGVDTQVRTTSYTYYANGRLQSEVTEPDSTVAGVKLTTSYEYDPIYGNRTKATPNGWNGELTQDRLTSTGWDANGRFPTSTTNALNKTETRIYDPRFGTVTKLIDVNSLMTKWEYDGLGRKTKESRGFANDAATIYTDYTEWRYEKCVDLPGGCASVQGVPPVYVVSTFIMSSANAKLAPTTKVYSDRLGRELRTETEGLTNSTVKAIYKDTVYNTRGQVLKVSLPYFYDTTAQWIGFEYDDLGRKRFETAANGIRTETTYTALQTTTTVHAAEGDRSKIVKRNGAGNTVEVVDANNRSAYFIADANGNPTHSVDPYGNTTVTTFDIRGRKTALNDPDVGAWNYVYNAFNELVTQTDAKSQVTTQKYDVVGRMFKRIEANLTTDYVYDTAGMGVGKLAQTYTSNGYCRTHGYDALGRPQSTTVGVGGTNPCAAPTDSSLTSSVTYDSASRPETTSFPTGLVLKNAYNANLGFLATVFNNTGNAAGTAYWTWQESDAFGHVTKYLNGNNVSTLKGYDPQTTWLSSIHAGSGGNPVTADVQYADYSYDSIGNLAQRTDRFQLPNLVEKAQHDLLGRLSWTALYDSGGSNEQSGTRVTVTYDAIGNIKTKSDVGTYYYNTSGGGSVRPHAVTDVRGAINASYVYGDANGNMTSGASRGFVYTSYNAVSEVGNDTSCQRFLYQGEHQRVQQSIYNTRCQYATESNLVGKTLYLHPDAANGLSFEREAKGGVTTYKHYINAGGLMVGMVSTTTASVTNNSTGVVSYFHYDHLGSVVAVTNAASAVIERRSFDPWGKARQVDGTAGTGELPNGLNAATDRGYTLHEHLEGLGLIHMNGRVYDFAIGRFVSPDPLVQDPADLQSYNRYAYVMNRPLNSTDPTGYAGEENCYFCFGGSGNNYSFGLSTPKTVDWFAPANASFGTGGNGVTNLGASFLVGQSYNNFLALESTMPLWANSTSTQRMLGDRQAAKGLSAGDVVSNLWNSGDNWIGLGRNVATAVGTTAWNVANFLGAGAAGDSQWAADSLGALLYKDRDATISTAMVLVGSRVGSRTSTVVGKDALLTELSSNGVKFTAQNIVDVRKLADGRVIFLETGNSKAGLQHIVEAHGADFARAGVPAGKIPTVVMDALAQGKIVGYQGADMGRPIYELPNGQRIAVTVGGNGFVVGANPAGR